MRAATFSHQGPQDFLRSSKHLHAHHAPLAQDVIQKCLSETQKLHIGAAIDDPLAAGSSAELDRTHDASRGPSWASLLRPQP